MKHMKSNNINNMKSKTFPTAIIVSKFNEQITSKLKDGALERLKDKGFQESQITLIEVPGAIEIPLIAKSLAKSGGYGAIIALGAVIRGETTHYDYVCQQVSYGCQKVSLEFEIPVIFGVLTTEDEQQALERVGGKHGHKGKDAVDTAIEMQLILQKINNKN